MRSEKHCYKNESGRLDIKQFSKQFAVRKMNIEDAQLIYDMTSKNLQYYECCGRMNTLEDIYNDLKITPPGVHVKDKYYVGFFNKKELISVLDLIDGFPDETTAYIGFFMMNIEYQGKGLATQLIAELLDYLKNMRFEKVRLGYDKENPQSSHFWKKQKFCILKEVSQEDGIIVVAERRLKKRLYIDVTEEHSCLSVWMKDAEIIRAGTTIYAMSVKDKNEEYDRYAESYDIQFIFADDVPNVSFYTIPQVDIFAIDSKGGYIGTIGTVTDMESNAQICYIDKENRCYLVAENGKEFLSKVDVWKEKLELYECVRIYDSYEAARKENNFIDIDVED